MPRDAPFVATVPAPAPDTGCLPRGYRLREFVIEQVLAEGGFGVVYAAIDLRLERRVAIKEYMPASLARRGGDLSVQPRSSVPLQDAFATGLRSFINEARMLAGFDHPTLVRVLQFWEDKGTGFMVMPLYQAPNVRQWTLARAQAPDAAWLQAFLDRLLEALALVHGEACLHRDIAPDNILLQRDAEPLLLDFGAARRVLEELTQTLTVIVKPGYAPIEQYAQTAGMRQGPWTDLYALCATVHFMLTRRAPPPAVGRMAEDDYVPLATALSGRYPPALLRALDAGLAVRPSDRPQSVADLRALLGAAPAHAMGFNVTDGLHAAAGTDAAAPADDAVTVRLAPIADVDLPDPVVVSEPAATTGDRPAAAAGSLADLVLRRPLSPRTVTATVALATVLSSAYFWQRDAPATGLPVATAPSGAPDGVPIPILRSPDPSAQTETGAEAVDPATANEVLESRAPEVPDAAPTRAVAAAAGARPAAPASPSPQRLAELARLRSDAARPVSPPAEPLAAGAMPVPSAASPRQAQTPRDLPPVPSRLAPSSHSATDAAVEPTPTKSAARNSAEPGFAATLELRPLERPRPDFPVEAARSGIQQGRVIARLHVAADGRVERVEIVESSPRRAFDRSVVSAARQWRYLPPGQARHVDVEFLFQLEG